jgi:predicted GIY-YIG superfamily endonuclease
MQTAKVDRRDPAAALLRLRAMFVPKRFVYILTSESEPNRSYTGLTSDPQRRLDAHNRGACSHTVNGRPWRLVVTIEFAREERAVAFERYLKSGSGSAFAVRHFR